MFKRLFFVFSIALLISSCSSNDEQLSKLVNDKIETMTGQEVIRDLLIENDGDIEQIARVFGCSVSTINRILDGKTFATETALKEFKDLLKSVKIAGKIALKDRDPYYDSWIRSFRFWLNKYIWKAFFLLILMMVLGACMGFVGGEEFAAVLGTVVSLPLIIIFGGGYLITWIGNILFPYVADISLHAEKLNVVFERLL